ncbi:unnamed protein product [Parascedosporium putredinis]|uniref:S-adenosyl-L-methionine:L-histidine 3-amino-3-carboxypropyltransferase 2 n=1 Tax=Parascedosporium putredinis TaxID=1442378 RepID=A0A9P1MDV6_9PEZI|nr:unnamed protein product [Parascedosporium putredinis]CAI8003357.1 unnamed protein product [Parascedosporium putredinis]
MSELAAAPVLSTPADDAFDFAPAADLAPRPRRPDHELRSIYEIDRTAREICAGGWERVALQFPDSMLSDIPWNDRKKKKTRLYVLADTAYSACCVDEIAAEHANAQVVVHYGRSCLSPTARLPVIYVFTRYPLDHDAVVRDFESVYPDKDANLIVLADVTYQDHVEPICSALRSRGHLLLAPTNTAALLRRRFARVLSLAGAGTVGILVNTLSVANYLPSIDALRARLARAAKKSYTVVVGKLNPAKLANFAEIDGWVVVGCWESGLVEDDRAYFMPVVTPFELEVALMDETERTWAGEWWGGIEGLRIGGAEDQGDARGGAETRHSETVAAGEEDYPVAEEVEGGVEGEESAPPEFDLRTGKLISHSRPMRRAAAARSPLSPSSPAAINGGASSPSSSDAANSSGLALVKRDAGGELATINGIVSTGAEYLRSRRTWQGLGTEFDAEESTVVEEGRKGVARGYAVGEETRT